MKLSFLALVALLPAVALAAPSGLPPMQEPLRYAHVRGEIKKYDVVNRSYVDPGESVCAVDAKVPVYGKFEDGKVLANAVIADCVATSGGKAQTVQLLASVLTHEARGNRPAVKELDVLFMNYEPGEPRGEFAVQSGSAAADPESSTLGLTLYAGSIATPLHGEKVETFVVSLTVSDDQR